MAALSPASSGCGLAHARGVGAAANEDAEVARRFPRCGLFAGPGAAGPVGGRDRISRSRRTTAPRLPQCDCRDVQLSRPSAKTAPIACVDRASRHRRSRTMDRTVIIARPGWITCVPAAQPLPTQSEAPRPCHQTAIRTPSISGPTRLRNPPHAGAAIGFGAPGRKNHARPRRQRSTWPWLLRPARGQQAREVIDWVYPSPCFGQDLAAGL